MIPLPLTERLKKLFRNIGERLIVEDVEYQPWSSRSRAHARLVTFCKYLRPEDLYAANWEQDRATRFAERNPDLTSMAREATTYAGIEYLNLRMDGYCPTHRQEAEQLERELPSILDRAVADLGGPPSWVPTASQRRTRMHVVVPATAPVEDERDAPSVGA